MTGRRIQIIPINAFPLSDRLYFLIHHTLSRCLLWYLSSFQAVYKASNLVPFVVASGLILQNKIKRRDILKNVLVGAVARRRLTMYNGAQAPDRQQELAPTKNIEIPIH